MAQESLKWFPVPEGLRVHFGVLAAERRGGGIFCMALCLCSRKKKSSQVCQARKQGLVQVGEDRGGLDGVKGKRETEGVAIDPPPPKKKQF